MGFFDDLINNQSDDYIDVFIYIEELSDKYKSNPRSVIAYLLGVDIENLYFQDSTGAYYKSEEPCAVKNTLKELIFNLDQRIARAVRASNTPKEAINETVIFEEMWDSTQYGSFKRSELPKIPNNDSIKHPTAPPRQIIGGIAKVGSLVTIQERETAAIPNKFQNMTMLNDYFTPHQASCLMAGLHPNFNGSDDELEIARTVIDGGIKSGKLILDDDGQIESENLKKFLSDKSWLLLGFNDYVTSKNSTSLGTFLKKIDNEKLKTELEKAKERISELEQQISKQVIMPADDVQLNGIAKYNANKAYVIATAQALASFLWSMDTTKAIRTGDMVQQVRHVIHSVAPKLLPDDKAIRVWLSDIAPDYAKKGGKTPKDAPSEISLTMKK